MPNEENLKKIFEMASIQTDRDLAVWNRKNEDFLVKQLAMEKQLVGRID